MKLEVCDAEKSFIKDLEVAGGRIINYIIIDGKFEEITIDPIEPFGSVKLPESIGQLSNLKVLYADNLKFAKFPNGFSKLKKIEKIYAGYNSIQDIKIIGSLVSLKYLDLVGNYIDDISPISNLVNLEVLQLENNLIAKIPESLTNLKNLKRINLYNNPKMFKAPDFLFKMGLEMIGIEEKKR